MAIDDPISSLQALNASDERQRVALPGIAASFLKAVKLLAPEGASITIEGFQAAVDWSARRASRNRDELLDVVAEEVKRQGSKLERLADNQEQRRFVENELGGLVLDALRRAENTRAKDRVRRLGLILVHASVVGATDGADFVEDMMSIATALSDLDVVVLHRLAVEYRKEKTSNRQEAQRSLAERTWARVANSLPKSMTSDDLISIGLKLDGVGIAARVEKQPWEDPVFRPLDRGYRFLEYIDAATSGANSRWEH